MKAAPFTYCRVSTDDLHGKIASYVGEGELTNDPLKTFGGYGVVNIPNFQNLLHYICENGFEHHVAINLSQVSGAVSEALDGVPGESVFSTSEIYERDGVFGFANPLNGKFLYRR